MTAARTTILGATLATVAALSGCSPDHLQAWDYDAPPAVIATYEDTRMSYRNADPGRALKAVLPGRHGREARRERYEDTRTPQCDDRFVLRHIERRTPIETRNVTHNPLTIRHFEAAHESQYVPRHGRNQIAQRFCRVRATFSDHKKRAIFYVVETPMGFAGVGHNVTYCIAGLDPWYVHGHDCSSLRQQGPAHARPLPEPKKDHKHDLPVGEVFEPIGKLQKLKVGRLPLPALRRKPVQKH